MELSFREIALRLNIALGTAFNHFQVFERTSRVQPKMVKKRPNKCKLDRHHKLYVISLVLENPTLFLGEICSAIKEITGTKVAPSALCKLLGKYGLSWKKIQRVALQRNELQGQNLLPI